MCNVELSRQRYQGDREKRIAAEREKRAERKRLDPEAVYAEEHYRYWEKKKKDPIGYMLVRIRRAAKVKKVPFNLERADIFIPEHCPVLGIKLRPFGTGRGDDCAEVDRMVPELGYVRGNVAIISHRANRIKDNGSPEEHERIAAWMRSGGYK